MNIIKDDKSLEKFCKSLKSQKFITVDTEFVREKTFFPVLCLIQIGTPRKSAVIDVLAEITDYSPLKDILVDENIVKVFHSARQDIEAFYCLLKIIPTPLFDTQIAAMAIGFGDAVSYQCLVQHFCKLAISKGQRLTDWTKRPLSESQLEYALSDVTHLVKIYRDIVKKLENSNRQEWIKEELESMLDITNYEINLDNAWERLKPKNTTRNYLANLKEIVAFRDGLAIKMDKPRKYIMADESLLEIALLSPKNTEELASIRSLQKRNDGEVKYKDEILKALATANPDGVVMPKKVDYDFNNKVSHLKPLIDMLKLLLNVRCSVEKVSSKLVANQSDIEEIAVNGINADNKTLKGWRLDFFGKDALLLRAGKLTISYDSSKNKIVTTVKI